MTTIEITGLPVLREEDGALAPAFSAALRTNGWVEMRIVRDQSRTRIFLTSSLENYDFLRVDDVLFRRVELSPAAKTMCAFSRAVRKDIITGQAAQPFQACTLDALGNDISSRRYLFAALQSMPDGVGLSIFIQRKPDSLPPVVKNKLRAGTSAGGVGGILADAHELFEVVGCLYLNSRRSLDFIADVKAAFPGMSFASIPAQWPDPDALVRALDPLSTLFLPDEAEILTSLLPMVEYGIKVNPDTIPGRTHLPPGVKKRGIELGCNARGEAVCIPWTMVCKHTIIAGPPSSGKTNCIFHLLFQLRSADVPVILIEPSKAEYHHLQKRTPVDVWRPISGGYVLNPFAVPQGVSLGEYRSTLLNMLENSFHLSGPLVELFATTLSRCFARCGWAEGSCSTDKNVEPFGLHEFLIDFTQLVRENGYSASTKSDILEAGKVRLNRLFSENPSVFDTVRSIPVGALFSGCNILQLNALTSVQSKQLFMSLLFFSLGAYLKLRLPHSTSEKPKLVILVDEAHNLFANLGESESASFARDFTNLMLELRSVGVGVVLADQTLLNLPEVVCDVAANKIFMSGARSSGILKFAPEMSLDETSQRNLWMLGPGTGLYFNTMNPQSLFFEVPNVIDGLHIETPCSPHNEWLERNPRFTTDCFKECARCPAYGHCTQRDKEVAFSASMRVDAELGNSLAQAKGDERNRCLVTIKERIKALNLTEVQQACTLVQFSRLQARR